MRSWTPSPGPSLYAVDNEPAGQRGCLAGTGQRMGSLGLFLAMQPERLWWKTRGRTTLNTWNYPVSITGTQSDPVVPASQPTSFDLTTLVSGSDSVT